MALSDYLLERRINEEGSLRIGRLSDRVFHRIDRDGFYPPLLSFTGKGRSTLAIISREDDREDIMGLLSYREVWMGDDADELYLVIDGFHLGDDFLLLGNAGKIDIYRNLLDHLILRAEGIDECTTVYARTEDTDTEAFLQSLVYQDADFLVRPHPNGGEQYFFSVTAERELNKIFEEIGIADDILGDAGLM